jgi:hypothetical protein
VVLGTLADSHVVYQMHLSSRLALEHPELAEDLVMHMLSRQLDNDSGGQRGSRPLKFVLLVCTVQ